LSLRSLAERVGMTPSLLSDIETGKSEGRPSALRKLAGVLRVDMDDLMRPPNVPPWLPASSVKAQLNPPAALC
jgi:transcriptional regulator with XRE-family HTH domain